MSKIAHNFYIVVLLAFIASSCIRETLPECPPQLIVKLAIEDMNYFNIAQFPQITPESEMQPFSHFTGTIYYTLTDVVTKKVVSQSDVQALTENSPYHTITFSNIPQGKYELSVWGNLTDDLPVGVLHQNGLEHTDIYTAQMMVDIASDSQTKNLELKRAKGKLVVFCNNFPNEITRITEAISPVYQSVDAAMNYQGSTNIQKVTLLKTTNETFVAPTPQGNTTKLNLSFYADSNAETPLLIVPEMEIAIQRNEISAVIVDYNTIEAAWDIWIYVKGEWTMIHHLDIK